MEDDSPAGTAQPGVMINGGCYKFYSGKINNGAARLACGSKPGWRLAIIADKETMDLVNTHLVRAKMV